MTRFSALTLMLAAACASEPAKPDPAVEARNAALLKQHTDIWNLMGLSQRAKDELNGIVVAVNSQMMANKKEDPEAYAKMSAVKRADPKHFTHEDYAANHKRRFDALGVSPETQKELMASADFVWQALHDPAAAQKFTDEQRKTAGIIQDMMHKLAGPPPCCDDNIFMRAQP